MMDHRVLIPLLFGILATTVLISLALGRYFISPLEIGRFLAHEALGVSGMDARSLETLKTVLVHIRMPRVVGAVLVGAALSVSGATLQSIFVNPLVSPGLLGILAGASFGAALGMFFSSTWMTVQASAVLFGMVAVAFAVGLAALYRGDRILLLVLGGIISSSLFNSLYLMMKYLANPYSQLPAIIYWLMGGFSLADSRTTFTLSFPILAGILLLLLLSPYLNILTMGEEEARSLGVNAGSLRLLFIFTSTLISSLTVALCGTIGWVGLLVPHMGRMLVGPDNRILLPVSAVIGATFLLVVDDVSRLLFEVEIPIGILTSLLGIPVFAGILGNTRKGWGRWS
ncbi:MAG: iron ABC transporter permease [Syntrophobacteraceae bacterium]|nr:iron ABC transporter permease [Syntrophobacteraceae bacterium]